MVVLSQSQFNFDEMERINKKERYYGKEKK